MSLCTVSKCMFLADSLGLHTVNTPIVTVKMMNHSEDRISSRKGRPLEAWLSGDLHFAFANMVKAYIQEDGLLLNST